MCTLVWIYAYVGYIERDWYPKSLFFINLFFLDCNIIAQFLPSLCFLPINVFFQCYICSIIYKVDRKIMSSPTVNLEFGAFDFFWSQPE